MAEPLETAETSSHEPGSVSAPDNNEEDQSSSTSSPLPNDAPPEAEGEQTAIRDEIQGSDDENQIANLAGVMEMTDMNEHPSDVQAESTALERATRASSPEVQH